MAERHIFITGAAGYVGRNLLRHFIAKGDKVTGLVRNPEAAERLASWGARPVLGDMLTADLAPLLSGADGLIHAAANVDHGAGSAAASVNPAGTRRVLEAAAEAGIDKVVHISTDSVLQDSRPLRNVDETTPYPDRPAGAYAAGKAEAERIALRAAAQGQHVVILRPRMVWGRDDTTALPVLVEAVKSGRFAWISDGGYRSSSLHIANLCHAVDLAFAHGGRGAIYHVTDGPARPFRETVSGLLESQGLDAGSRSVPRGALRMIARLGDGMHRLSGGRLKGPISFQDYATSAVEITLDTRKAERELGYRPVISFEEGLSELRARR
ncbi:NAD-dependent epimerase/dehydratase family protein [Martelella mediterranea]|uniref:NAD-dependent epimerase/dehydratase family protein n=1 Tax=Martelella mediterranea TaxID=293089 RepID=UPI001E393598|nr:NAD-dependent epimerase/dehydratase family protein [Martelella mediterranea]MCD1632565.1 NAD-dependent epimerase/dehydratase family protein [Martelella mediterranea]